MLTALCGLKKSKKARKKETQLESYTTFTSLTTSLKAMSVIFVAVVEPQSFVPTEDKKSVQLLSTSLALIHREKWLSYLTPTFTARRAFQRPLKPFLVSQLNSETIQNDVFSLCVT